MTNLEILWNLVTRVEVRFLFCVVFGILFAYEWTPLYESAKVFRADRRERNIWGALTLGCIIGIISCFV